MDAKGTIVNKGNGDPKIHCKQETEKPDKRTLKDIAQVSAQTKSERMQLPGHDCEGCRSYYIASGYTGDALEEKLNKQSRHRCRQKRPSTPEGFWDPGLCDSDEEDTKKSEGRAVDNKRDNKNRNGSGELKDVRNIKKTDEWSDDDW